MGQSASRACCSGPEARSLELKPYGDISGIGVIIGFVGTGYLVLLLMILSYLVSYDPTQSPWPGEENRYRWHANPIDVLFLRWIRRIKPSDPNPFRGPGLYLQRSIDKSILTLCDVQLVTGLGILTCAFILGAQCKLDAYHWQMIVHLAWFSAVTHLSGLFALRNRIATSRWPKYTRVGIMFSLLVILLVATVPTIFFNWSRPRTWTHQITAAQANSTSICFLDLHYGVQRYHQSLEKTSTLQSYGTPPSLQDTHQFQAAIFSIILLIFGFTTRLVKLFGVLSRSSNRFTRDPLSSLGKKFVRKITSHQSRWPFGLWDAAVQQPTLAIFMMLRIVANLASSMLTEVYWLLCVVLWGNVKLISTRNSAGKYIVKEEDEWTFGQILPVLLLVGPFIAISSTIASDFYKARYSIRYTGLRSSESISLDNINIPTRTERDMDLGQSDTTDATHIIHAEATPQDTEIQRVDESRQNLRMPPSHKDLEFWLNSESSMRHPWIVICSTMPSLLAFAMTIVLFAFIYSFIDPKPVVSLSRFWVSEYGFLSLLLVDFPVACTGTVLVALRLNPPAADQPRNSARYFIFFWLCFIIYTFCIAGSSVFLIFFFPNLKPPTSKFFPLCWSLFSQVVSFLHLLCCGVCSIVCAQVIDYRNLSSF